MIACAGQVLCRPAADGQQPAAPSRGNYHIHTMGCQMNLADSERMAGALEVGLWLAKKQLALSKWRCCCADAEWNAQDAEDGHVVLPIRCLQYGTAGCWLRLRRGCIGCRCFDIQHLLYSRQGRAESVLRAGPPGAHPLLHRTVCRVPATVKRLWGIPDYLGCSQGVKAQRKRMDTSSCASCAGQAQAHAHGRPQDRGGWVRGAAGGRDPAAAGAGGGPGHGASVRQQVRALNQLVTPVQPPAELPIQA